MQKDKIVQKIKSMQWESTNADEISSFLQHAIGMKPKKGEVPIGASKFGGLPDLPDTLKWPVYKSQEEAIGIFAATYDHVDRQKEKCNLPFIAQFNISEFKHLDFENILPEKGMIYFFSDTQPDEILDHRILLYDGDEDSLKRTPLPKSLKKYEKGSDFIPLLKKELGFDFFEFYCFPSDGCYKIDDIQLSESDEENIQEMIDFIDETFGAYGSYLLGEPWNIQGDVYDAWLYDMLSVGVHSEEIQEKIEGIKKALVLLFQLDGYALGLDDIFDGWVGDGLIYFGTSGKSLKGIKKGELEFSAINCAYT